MRQRQVCRLSLSFADRVELFLQGQLIEGSERQAHEDIDAVRQHPQRIRECEPHFRLGAGGCGWIGHTPMRRHWLPRPERTDLLRGVVADREDEIEFRCVRSRKLFPALGSQAGHVVVQPSQQIEGVGMNPAFRVASCRERSESACPDRLRIASAMIERAEFPVQRNKTL